MASHEPDHNANTSLKTLVLSLQNVIKVKEHLEVLRQTYEAQDEITNVEEEMKNLEKALRDSEHPTPATRKFVDRYIEGLNLVKAHDTALAQITEWADKVAEQLQIRKKLLEEYPFAKVNAHMIAILDEHGDVEELQRLLGENKPVRSE